MAASPVGVYWDIPRTAWNMHHRAKLRPYKMTTKNEVHHHMFLTHAILGRCIATNKLWKPREATQQCSNTSTSLVPRHWLPQMSSGTCTASYPGPPSTLQEERGVWWISTTFLYLCSEFQDTIWLADFKITSIPPILGFLTTNHLAT